MKYVVCMSNGMGHFHSSPGSHGLGILQAEQLPRASIQKKNKNKKIPCRQLPEFGARLIRTPHCLSETNVLIKSIVVGLDGTKCY